MVSNRRSFLRYGLAVSGLLMLPKPSLSAQMSEKVLRLGFTHSRGSQTGQTAQAFADEVFQQSNGRIRVNLHFGGSLGGEKEVAEDVAAGVVDFCITSSVGYAGPMALPKLGIFDVPFLFRDITHARSVIDGPIGKAALVSLRSVGLEGLAWGENGLRQITTRDKPVRKPSDLLGMKLRVPPSETALAAFKGFGANPSAMPANDVYAALADGSMDAQENDANRIKSAEFYQVQKYLCLTNHIYSTTMLLASERSFDALSAEDRQIVRQAALSFTPRARQINDSTSASDITELAQLGMTVVKDVDRAAFVEANAKTQPIYEKMFGADAILAIQNFKG